MIFQIHIEEATKLVKLLYSLLGHKIANRNIKKSINIERYRKSISSGASINSLVVLIDFNIYIIYLVRSLQLND